MKTVKIQVSRERKLKLKQLGFNYTVAGIFFIVETELTHSELLKLL